MNRILSAVFTDPFQIRKYLPKSEVAEPTSVKIAKFVTRGTVSSIPTSACFAFDTSIPLIVLPFLRLMPSSLITVGTYLGGEGHYSNSFGRKQF